MATKDNVSNINAANDVVDIDLSVTRKKRFRIDKDDSRILELNTSDIGVVKRLRDGLPELDSLNDSAYKTISDSEDELDISSDAAGAVTDALHAIDEKMRWYLDYIFDAPVSEMCAPSGTMYDPFDGQFRYQHILATLSKLYENNFELEYKKMAKNVQKHTGKYTQRKA